MIDLIDGYKKILAAIVASVLAFLGLMNDFSVAEITLVISPLVTFILGMGLADIGKERAKVESSVK